MKFKVPEGVTSVSLGGIEYRVVGGAVEVAAEHADELAYHGCVPWPAPDPALIPPTQQIPSARQIPAHPRRHQK